LAALALDHGFTPEDVAGATPGGTFTISGNESVFWQERCEDFRRLEDHSDPRLVQVGRLGRERMQTRAEKARRQERHEAVYGDE
jgi:hypothetical protein